MARQDSRHKGPEESKDTKHAYSLKASIAKWIGHVIKMPDERLPLSGVQLMFFSFAPELENYSAPRDLHRRAAY